MQIITEMVDDEILYSTEQHIEVEAEQTPDVRIEPLDEVVVIDDEMLDDLHYIEVSDVLEDVVEAQIGVLDEVEDELELLEIVVTDEMVRLHPYLEQLLIMVEVEVEDDQLDDEMVETDEDDIDDQIELLVVAQPHITDDEVEVEDDEEVVIQVIDEIDANEQLLLDIRQTEAVEYLVLLDEIVYILVEIIQFTALLQTEYLLLLCNNVKILLCRYISSLRMMSLKQLKMMRLRLICFLLNVLNERQKSLHISLMLMNQWGQY